VCRYQKKHSPTHHPDHHPIFISFFHLPWSIVTWQRLHAASDKQHTDAFCCGQECIAPTSPLYHLCHHFIFHGSDRLSSENNVYYFHCFVVLKCFTLTSHHISASWGRKLFTHNTSCACNVHCGVHTDAQSLAPLVNCDAINCGAAPELWQFNLSLFQFNTVVDCL